MSRRRLVSAIALVLLPLGLTLTACSDDQTVSVSSGPTADAAPAVGSSLGSADFAAALKLPGTTVLDVRTPAEFAEGHIEGATVIDYNAPGFEEAVGELDRSVPYFVYCHSGNRSAGAVAVMTALGFERLYELDGGIVAWQAAAQPLTT